MGRETAAPLALPSARRFDADEADGVRWFLVRRKRTQGARIGRIRRLGWYRIHPRASGIFRGTSANERYQAQRPPRALQPSTRAGGRNNVHRIMAVEPPARRPSRGRRGRWSQRCRAAHGPARERQRPPAPSPAHAAERSGGGRHPGCSRLRHLSRGGVEGGPKRRVARKCGEPGEQSSPTGSSELAPKGARGDRTTARSFGASRSKWRRTSARDKGCPGRSGWGKSTVASGRCVGVQESIRKETATPGLRQSG
jgi:hypothetical protein